MKGMATRKIWALAALVTIAGCGGSGGTSDLLGNNTGNKNGFTAAFRFTKPTDTIQLTGSSLTGATLLGSQFTVEVVIKPNSAAGNIWQQWTSGQMNDVIGFSGGSFQAVTSPPQTTMAGTAVNQSVWVHLAWCYNGAYVTLYQNGQLTASYTEAAGFDPVVAATASFIGSNEGVPADGSVPFSGDLATMRISNVVRYSGTSFTPPTQRFTADANTLLLIDASSFSSAPTSFPVPGSQGLTATLGAGGSSATSPALVAYTGF
jgi:hypothetical protein